MESKSHAYVAQLAIQYVNNPVITSNKKKIIKACKKYDKHYLLGLPTVEHFYNPYLDKGLFKFRTAKDLLIAHFAKAIRKKSFAQLGKALHLVQDLSIPAHTLIFSHLFGQDDLEKYLGKHMKKFNIKPYNVKEMFLPNMIDDLAKKSCKFVCFNSTFEAILSILRLKKKLPKKELDKQSKAVLANSLSYSIALIKLFLKEIETK